MQGGHREGLAEAELPHGGGLGLGALIIDFVGGQHHGLPATAQHLHDSLVDVLGANGRIDNKDHCIRRGDGEFGLLCDPRSHSLRIRSPATGVHQHKLAPVPGGVIGDPVTSYSRHVLDHSLPATEHAVHQGRLTDIGSANNCHHRQTCDSSAVAMSLIFAWTLSLGCMAVECGLIFGGPGKGSPVNACAATT